MRRLCLPQAAEDVADRPQYQNSRRGIEEKGGGLKVNMGIFERLANAIFRTATGDAKKRLFFTPLVALIFLAFIILLIVAAILTDAWLKLPSISSPPWTVVLSAVLLAAGIIFYAWTIANFRRARGTPVPINPPKELVISGPYAHSRNPMLTSLYLIFFGAGILWGSLSFTLIYTPFFILVNTVYIKQVEEREMELKFGQDYLDYKKRVPLYFPRFR
jgi:protein-S-isoprenylcysteine O-methyltransferase Ste14